MATAVVSGRVDEKVKLRADAYIRAAGTTPGDVIRVVWEHIARTGEVPSGEERAESAAALDRLKQLRASFGESEWLVNLTDEDMRDAIATRYA